LAAQGERLLNYKTEEEERIMSPISWIVIGIAAIIVVAWLTPQGRRALKSITNSIGSALGLAAREIETPDRQREELEARLEAETGQALSEAQTAYASAQGILERQAEMRAELTQWEENRDQAVITVRRLMADKVPDEKQQEQIGQAKAIGETAMGKIAALKAAVGANAPNVEWANNALAEAEKLFRLLPQRAEEMLRAGDVAAATQELATAQVHLAASQSAFSGSEAAGVLKRMRRTASRKQATAKAAQARAIAAPASATLAAQQLASLGETPSFDEFLAETSGESG